MKGRRRNGFLPIADGGFGVGEVLDSIGTDEVALLIVGKKMIPSTLGLLPVKKSGCSVQASTSPAQECNAIRCAPAKAEESNHCPVHAAGVEHRCSLPGHWLGGTVARRDSLCTGSVQAGNVIGLTATVDTSKERKPKGHLHWVRCEDAVAAEVNSL